jgi:hypothetical protein
MPSRIGWLAILAGCVSGLSGSLVFGPFFAVAACGVLILGAFIQPHLPRAGRWILAVGAVISSFYVGVFVAPQAAGMLWRLPLRHEINDIGLCSLFVLSTLLVAYFDFALVRNTNRLKSDDLA